MKEFGGDWTRIKLESLKKYLKAYLTIFEKGENAKRYKTVYIDAFAGDGENVFASDSNEYELSLFDDDVADNKVSGSAKMVLELEKKFDKYIFIESDPVRCAKLELLKGNYAAISDRIEIINGDANEVIDEALDKYDWEESRAVMFIDPFGLQVKFTTLRKIALTKAIDVWLLVPLGVGIARLLKNDGNISEENTEKLNSIFGCTDWYHEIYEEEISETLFGKEKHIKKCINTNGLISYVGKRLSSIFTSVSPLPLQLKNSKGNSIFVLYFMVSNPVQSNIKLAMKIANGILESKNVR